MNLSKFIFTLLFGAITLLSAASDKGVRSVNAVIGDLSFVHKFGSVPTEKTDEVLRIQTHLEFVEALLRNKRVSHLTAAQKKNRAHLLDLLHTYWNAGVFPCNYDYEGRRISCFIDKETRICAVGFLIEQTAGRDVAEAINVKFKYSNIMDMDDQVVEDWIASSGFTKLECAMIQPTYGYENHNPPSSYTWTAPVVYVRDTKTERKLQAELDSQLVIVDQLQTQVDSLSLKLTYTEKVADSLTTVNAQKDQDMSQFKEDSSAYADTLIAAIWALSTLVGAGLIFGLIQWFKPARAL
jgi:hypothetical protein